MKKNKMQRLIAKLNDARLEQQLHADAIAWLDKDEEGEVPEALQKYKDKDWRTLPVKDKAFISIGRCCNRYRR